VPNEYFDEKSYSLVTEKAEEDATSKLAILQVEMDSGIN
jgi:hypothetical protein